MVYKLIITERAEELLEECVRYLIYKLKNDQAAGHLLDGMDKIYSRLEENPYQFPECRDRYLNSLKYREAVITDMNYLAIFKVENNNVYVLGIFHQLEDYRNKM